MDVVSFCTKHMQLFSNVEEFSDVRTYFTQKSLSHPYQNIKLHLVESIPIFIYIHIYILFFL